MKNSIEPRLLKMRSTMNNRKQYLLLSIWLVGVTPLFAIGNKAQTNPSVQILQPSSEAQSLGEFAEIPVDLYTGRTNINIPLFTISYNDIEVPISISYHGGGIKVDEEAGAVGLGWTLNASGVINRIVRGMPDELYEAGKIAGYNHLDRLKVSGSPYNRYHDFITMMKDKPQDMDPNGMIWSSTPQEKILLQWMQHYGILYDEGHFDTSPDNFLFSVQGISGAFDNNIVYQADNSNQFGIKFVHNPEGYIRYYGPEEHYHFYYIKDHLGNVRETYIHPEVNYKECVERTQYYPSGLPWVERLSDSFTAHPWKYNGKEFVEMHGLDEYDSEARWYYPAICRTTTMDPLAEKYYATSPYAWCGNNPIRNVDRNGKWIESAWDAANVVIGVNSLITNIQEHNIQDAVIDGAGLILDVAAVILPVVPGGVSTAIKTARVADKVAEANKVSKTTILMENAQKGRDFERRVGETIGNNKASQVTIEVADGTKTRMDFVSIKDGELKLTEAKSSTTASLTPNQKKAHPQIEQSGGTIKGDKGNDIGLPHGSYIPPTKVDIVKPDNLNY